MFCVARVRSEVTPKVTLHQQDFARANSSKEKAIAWYGDKCRINVYIQCNKNYIKSHPVNSLYPFVRGNADSVVRGFFSQTAIYNGVSLSIINLGEQRVWG